MRSMGTQLEPRGVGGCGRAVLPSRAWSSLDRCGHRGSLPPFYLAEAVACSGIAVAPRVLLLSVCVAAPWLRFVASSWPPGGSGAMHVRGHGIGGWCRCVTAPGAVRSLRHGLDLVAAGAVRALGHGLVGRRLWVVAQGAVRALGHGLGLVAVGAVRALGHGLWCELRGLARGPSVRDRSCLG